MIKVKILALLVLFGAVIAAAGLFLASPAHAWGGNCYNGGYYVPSDCGGYPWTYYPQYYPPPPYGYGGGYYGGNCTYVRVFGIVVNQCN
jgi:hypothetical protein